MTILMTLLAVAAMVLVDQVVKYWAVTALAPMGSIPLIPGILQLTYVENRGAAFSLLENQTWLFVLLAAVVVGAIAYVFYKNLIQNTWGKVSLLVVCAGAIGNGIDRIMHQYVVDMIEVLFIRFPVFNIADIYVTVGVIMFSIYYLFQHKDREETGRI